MKIINKTFDSVHENIELYVLGDLHLEDKHNNIKQFEKWRNEVLAQENRYVITNGDLIDNATRDSCGDTFSAKLTPSEAINRMVELLEPIKHRIIAMTEGNHEARTYKKEGILITERISRELGLKDIYSEGAYLLFLNVGKNRGRETHQTVYSVYGKHGSGGGAKEGAKINRLVAMSETQDADLYLHSHTHVPIITKNSFYRSDYRHKMSVEVVHTFVNTNAFLNFGGYGESFGFKPAARDYPKIILHGREKDIKVIL